jgi:hypothetical protein
MAAFCRKGTPTFRGLLRGTTPRDHALLTLFLSLCFLHPFPMFGISTVLGAMIFLAGARMSLGMGPWVPKRWRDRPLPGETLAKVFGVAARGMRRLETVAHPRGAWVGHPWVLRLNGAGTALCGLLIMVPLPPPTNFPPALALLLLSMGVLKSDALWLTAGYFALAANVAFFTALFVYGSRLLPNLPF